MLNGSREQGKSFRISYAKRFDEINSQVNFAGYRFSEESFHSMSDYLALNNASGIMFSNEKERYLVSMSKQFTGTGVSASLNYNHQTWWHRPDTDRFDATLSTNLTIGTFRNVSASVRGYRQMYYGRRDDGVSLQLSLPWGERTYAGYSASIKRNEVMHSLNYSGYEDTDSWNLSAATQKNTQELSGFYSTRGDKADMSFNAAAGSNNAVSGGASLRGGLTVTTEGSAFHGAGAPGAGRILIDTAGVADVPLTSGGGVTRSNRSGKAVLTGAGDYQRAQARISIDQLENDMDSAETMTELTLTEGAIGYRKLDVIKGKKGMAYISMRNGGHPPFGINVVSQKGKVTGMVGESGVTWLSGMNSGEKMFIHLSAEEQCAITLPEITENTGNNALLLVCEPSPAISAG